MVNPVFEAHFGTTAEAAIGRSFEEVVGPFFSPSYAEYGASNPVSRVLRTGDPVLATERGTLDGRTFLTSCIPLPDGSVLCNFTDITAQKREEHRTELAMRELDQAFALMLPNSKVERKLKSSPEYRDVWDPETHRIEITEVITDGTYQHVINALKVASDLKRVGAMDGLGIDKDRVVQAMIYHDLGKIQPHLVVGDVVDPAEAFEPSKLHAARSADFAAAGYLHDEDTLALIRFHHHSERELPPSFPPRLLPMLRLVQLIDGLSAAVTRKSAHLEVMMDGPVIVIRETNPHARYNGVHRVDLFSGERGFIAM